MVSEAISNGQDLVHFDVGGKVFQVLRGTIMRFPDSLLAKLLVEFPDYGVRDRPVFVDRSARAFEWILEIYRDGDYQSCIPDMAEKALTKELAFYLLPSLKELGMELPVRLRMRVINEQVHLMESLLQKIHGLELSASFTFYVWFYRRFNGRRFFGEEHIAVKYAFSTFTERGIERQHDDFFRNVLRGDRVKSSERWLIVHHRLNRGLFGIRSFDDAEWFSQLQRVGRIHGLRLSLSNHCQKYPSSALVIDSTQYVHEVHTPLH
eukprot:g496.t1